MAAAVGTEVEEVKGLGATLYNHTYLHDGSDEQRATAGMDRIEAELKRMEEAFEALPDLSPLAPVAGSAYARGRAQEEENEEGEAEESEDLDEERLIPGTDETVSAASRRWLGELMHYAGFPRAYTLLTRLLGQLQRAYDRDGPLERRQWDLRDLQVGRFCIAMFLMRHVDDNDPDRLRREQTDKELEFLASTLLFLAKECNFMHDRSVRVDGVLDELLAMHERILPEQGRWTGFLSRVVGEYWLDLIRPDARSSPNLTVQPWDNIAHFANATDLRCQRLSGAFVWIIARVCDAVEHRAVFVFAQAIRHQMDPDGAAQLFESGTSTIESVFQSILLHLYFERPLHNAAAVQHMLHELDLVLYATGWYRTLMSPWRLEHQYQWLRSFFHIRGVTSAAMADRVCMHQMLREDSFQLSVKPGFEVVEEHQYVDAELQRLLDADASVSGSSASESSSSASSSSSSSSASSSSSSASAGESFLQRLLSDDEDLPRRSPPVAPVAAAIEVNEVKAEDEEEADLYEEATDLPLFVSDDGRCWPAKGLLDAIEHRTLNVYRSNVRAKYNSQQVILLTEFFSLLHVLGQVKILPDFAIQHMLQPDNGNALIEWFAASSDKQRSQELAEAGLYFWPTEVGTAIYRGVWIKLDRVSEPDLQAMHMHMVDKDMIVDEDFNEDKMIQNYRGVGVGEVDLGEMTDDDWKVQRERWTLANPNQQRDGWIIAQRRVPDESDLDQIESDLDQIYTKARLNRWCIQLGSQLFQVMAWTPSLISAHPREDLYAALKRRPAMLTSWCFQGLTSMNTLACRLVRTIMVDGVLDQRQRIEAIPERFSSIASSETKRQLALMWLCTALRNLLQARRNRRQKPHSPDLSIQQRAEEMQRRLRNTQPRLVIFITVRLMFSEVLDVPFLSNTRQNELENGFKALREWVMMQPNSAELRSYVQRCISGAMTIIWIQFMSAMDAWLPSLQPMVEERQLTFCLALIACQVFDMEPPWSLAGSLKRPTLAKWQSNLSIPNLALLQLRPYVISLQPIDASGQKGPAPHLWRVALLILEILTACTADSLADCSMCIPREQRFIKSTGPQCRAECAHTSADGTTYAAPCHRDAVYNTSHCVQHTVHDPEQERRIQSRLARDLREKRLQSKRRRPGVGPGAGAGPSAAASSGLGRRLFAGSSSEDEGGAESEAKRPRSEGLELKVPLTGLEEIESHPPLPRLRPWDEEDEDLELPPAPGSGKAMHCSRHHHRAVKRGASTVASRLGRLSL